MQLFRFDPAAGRTVGDHGSNGVALAPIVAMPADRGVSIALAYVHRGGRLGRHPAVCEQLFLVLRGSGWVSGDAGQRVPVREGQGVHWVRGESHEAGSDAGMAALIIESEGPLGPGPWLQAATPDGSADIRR